MRKKSVHVILMASVLIFSSIAGCLANEETDEENGDDKEAVAGVEGSGGEGLMFRVES